MIFTTALLVLLASASTQASGDVNVRHRSLNYFQDYFADGLETEYNDYAQAWRYLGIYVDCDAQEEQQQRRLEDGQDGQDENQEEAGDDAAAEGDDAQAGDDAANEEDQQNEGEGEGEEVEEDKFCNRYLLWGAYVDEDYSGAGLSEYKIFNSAAGKWDKTACDAGDSSRCVKMDCHSSGSSFKPLGYFRQDNPAEFLQLLAQGQASCTFKNGEAAALATEWLPNGCTQINDQDLYFDLKPMSGGNIGIGLYVDAGCSLEHSGNDIDIEDMLSAHYGASVSVEETLANLNSALDAYKTCQPCRTFDFSYVAQANENGDEEEQGDDANANNGEDPNNLNFICLDAAGNEGVNQCQVFAENSEIAKATFRDINLASSQGSIMQSFSGADAITGNFTESWGFFLLSALVCLAGILCFCGSAVKWRRVDGNKREPLIGSRR